MTAATTVRTIRIYGGELHLNRADTSGFLALEVGKVPARRDEVGTHALDRVHEHARAVDVERLALVHNVPLRSRAWPEPVYDIAVCTVWGGGLAKPRPAAVRAAAKTPPGRVRSTGDNYGDLQLRTRARGDGVRLSHTRLCRLAVVNNAELVRLRRYLVVGTSSSAEVANVR